MKMDFTVEVTKWLKGIEKTWETIGEAKMIIYSWLLDAFAGETTYEWKRSRTIYHV
jgi:hypothetical protein